MGDIDRKAKRRYEALTERLHHQIEEVSPGVYSVPSKSTPHDFHLVIRQADGTLVCDCEGARHGQWCRHVEAVTVFIGNQRYQHIAAQAPWVQEPWHKTGPMPRRKEVVLE